MGGKSDSPGDKNKKFEMPANLKFMMNGVFSSDS